MAFSLELGVTPEQLKAQASVISDDISAMSANIQSMSNEINGMSGYWKGDAGELQRRRFEESVSEMNRLMERLGSYPTRILQMAGIYEEAEHTSTTIAESTKTDIQMR